MNFRFPSKLNVDLKPGRRTLFALALIGVITASVFSYWNATRLIADEQLVTATHILVASLNTVSAAIKDIEPHVNRYATTSYSRTGALKMVETDLIVQVQDMAQLATISPDQWERVAALQQSIKSYFADLNTVARLNNNGTNFDQVLDEQQIQLSLIADKTVGEMIAEANLFLIQHETMSSATEQTTLTTLMLISAGSVLLFCVIFYSLNREVAKRQHMAAALTDNEQRLRTQYKSLPIPTYTWRKTDNEFVLVDHNDAAIEATQGHIGEWLGNKVHEMYSDMPSLVAMVERCYDEQKVIRWESQYRLRTTGATRDLDFTYVFVAPDSVMIHAEDITDRKRAQEAVAREHNLLRAVIDNLPDYIFAKDKNGYFTLTNIAHAQATNVTPAEMVGKTAYELFPQQMAEQFSLDDEATLQSGQALINVERETRDAEGNKRTVLTSKVPLRDAQNNVIGLIGISRDITELKKTQEALRASEERAGSIVAALSEAIVLRYVDGALQFMNPSAEQLMGTLVRDEEARPYFYDEYENILGDEHRPTAIALSIGKPQRDMLMRVKRLDGEMRWMSVSVQPLFRGSGDVPYATLASFSDITERMRLEEALSEALDQALEASRAKSTFLATMSHEIRTPMNGVIGMTDLVLDTPLSDEQRDMIEIIRTSANALLTIINDILDFSKIEAGKLTLESVDFQPITLVEGAADIIAPKAHEKKLSLMTFVDPAIPPILNGDIVRLQQILINLMGNAVKFTDRGEVVVRAILDERNASSATVRFSVSDSGIGLSESVRQRLFQPFMQADDSMTRRYGGTGLGLAICARLVELMHGKITVESREGAGSCFWFSVPLKISPKNGDVSLESPSAFDLKDLRVLVADGNAVSRDIIASYLLKWNSVVEHVATSEDALRELEHAAKLNRRYDVVLLDVRLPGMDVHVLANSIKHDRLISDTHLILLTDGPKNGQDSLFSASLSKPLKQQQLVQVLGTLSRSQVNRNGSAPAPILMEITAKGSQILLVEDNPINQRVAAMQLKKFGLSVKTVSNGQEALDILAAGGYSLILMDCQMPVIDGFEATRRIRQREAGSPQHIPIVAMTANAMQGDREQCLMAGMDDYISKPINLSELQIILEKWLPTS